MDITRPSDMAAPRMATATPPGQDDTRVRDLYNALRSGDHGVGCEGFLIAFYFLQHRFFSLFDVREAFATSTSSSERFLSYRDFQYALLKTARAFATSQPNENDAVLLVRLLDALTDQETKKESRRMDSIRRQLAKPSALAVLNQHMDKLIQSFQMYGTGNVVQTKATWATRDTSTPMTLDGFVDFLNGYFEYEEYFSFQTIEESAREVVGAFGADQESEVMLNFPHFIELLCRVASRFHVKTLEREGAQLRKAVESCRLEFSIELLMEKMDIRMFQDDEDSRSLADQESVRPATAVVVPGYESDVGGIEELTLDDGETNTAAQNSKDVQSMSSLLRDIKTILLGVSGSEVSKQQQTKQQRPQSVLFSRLPPRKSSPQTDRSHHLPPWIDKRQEDGGKGEKPWDPPQMTLIREVVSPPPLPSNILKRLEYAITFQNTGQYHMALGALHKCQTLYNEWRGNGLEEEVEVRVYLSLMTASVYDSARKDHRALAMYVDALRAAERLPLLHPGRALVKSSLGCVLYYIDELSLAKLCHEQVLDVRRHSPEGGDDHIDTATAMNNLACCLSQDQAGTAIEDAYLLLKTAKRVYSERFGVSHPRVETVSRNFDRVLASQRTIVVDPVGALARGKYSHVIPGSRFQIKALVLVKKEKTTGGKKKKKKGAKGAMSGKIKK